MDERRRKERLTNLKWGGQTMQLKVLPIPEANSATFRSTEPNLSCNIPSRGNAKVQSLLALTKNSEPLSLLNILLLPLQNHVWSSKIAKRARSNTREINTPRLLHHKSSESLPRQGSLCVLCTVPRYVCRTSVIRRSYLKRTKTKG
jgi:hypothetical protein